jgi:hypothetical protein
MQIKRVSRIYYSFFAFVVLGSSGLFCFNGTPCLAAGAVKTEIESMVFKTACETDKKAEIEPLNGGKLKISVDKDGGNQNLIVDRENIRGIIIEIGDLIGQLGEKEMVECLQRYQHKLHGLLAQQPPEPVGLATLPQNQLVSVGVPLSILDGKVSVWVEWIREGQSRKTLSRLIVEVPLRAPYRKNMYNAGSFQFQYKGRKYKLTILNPDLQNQNVHITIIRL